LRVAITAHHTVRGVYMRKHRSRGTLEIVSRPRPSQAARCASRT
jgi:hypothetical protein